MQENKPKVAVAENKLAPNISPDCFFFYLGLFFFFFCKKYHPLYRVRAFKCCLFSLKSEHLEMSNSSTATNVYFREIFPREAKSLPLPNVERNIVLPKFQIKIIINHKFSMSNHYLDSKIFE